MPQPAKMLRITANEIQHHLRNRGLPLACVCVTTLLLLAAFMSQRKQAQLNAQRAEYQQRVRTQWLEQPDRHPHRASHYGYLAFRPQAPLSFFDPGVESFAGTSIFLEAHRQNTANFSEARQASGMLRFGELSPALVLQLFAPLALFFLGFATITGERESGTLPMLFAQGVTWRELLLGKTLGLVVAGLIVTAPGAFGVALWWLFTNDAWPSATLWRALILAGVYGAYLLTLALLAVLVSAWHTSSRGALTSLLIWWIVFCVVVPRAAQMLGTALAPTPVKAEFDARLENDLAREGDSHNPDDPHFAALRANLLKQYSVADVKDLPFNYGAFVMYEAEKISSDIFRRHYGALLDTFRCQNRVSEWAALLNPYLAIRTLSMALSGSDLAHYTDFQWQAEAFRFDLVQRLNQLHMEEIKFENDRAQRLGHAIWQRFPDFQYQAPSLRWTLGQQGLVLAGMLGWSLLVLVAVGRCKPRLRV